MEGILDDLDSTVSYQTISAVCLQKAMETIGIIEKGDSPYHLYYSTKSIKTRQEMKIKKGFVLRNVCGENIIVAEGKENIDFTKIISMNESSAYLWKNVEGKEFTAEDLCHLLTSEYDVAEDVALKDAQAIANEWINAGIAE